ncbi:hypothetical protein [Bradyrhizobium erythrophlei]|nr:hypothetical protein [Bradyrhizobium erythrophlei]
MASEERGQPRSVVASMDNIWLGIIISGLIILVASLIWAVSLV